MNNNDVYLQLIIYITILDEAMVQLTLNFTHTCMYTHVLACLTCAKLQKKLACARTVSCNFDVRTWDSKHTQHMRDARPSSHLICHTTRVV